MAITNNQPLVNEIDQAIQNWKKQLGDLSKLKSLNKGGSTPQQLLISKETAAQTLVVSVAAGAVQGLTVKIVAALNKYPGAQKSGLASSHLLLIQLK
jgi:hypothetical protein